MKTKLAIWLPHRLVAILVSCLCFSMQTSTAQTTDLLIQEPASLLLPVNSDGIFTCRSIENTTVQWRIDSRGNPGLSFSDASKTILTNNGITELATNDSSYSKVFVEGLAENNNTVLVCQAVGMGKIESSDEATLQLYGPPGPPVDISVTVPSQLSLLVSWGPPFFPFINNVSITYTLFILKDGVAIVTVRDIEYNDTSYLFTANASDICQNISFVLHSVNDAGVGSNSSTVTRAVPEVPEPINSDIQAEVELNDSSVANLKLKFKSPSVCQYYPVLTYSINLIDATMSGNTHTIQSTIDDITVEERDNGEVRLLIEEGLEPDRIYRVAVTAINKVGKSGQSREVEFRTTDVQEIIVTYTDGKEINVMCIFAKGSLAQGCHIKVKTLMNQELIDENIIRNSTEEIATGEFDISGVEPLNISQLVVIGFDYETDGTIGEVSTIPSIKVVVPTGTPPPTAGTETSSVLVTMATILSSSTQPTPTVIETSGDNRSIVGIPVIIGVSLVGLLVVGVVIVGFIVAFQRCARRSRKVNESVEVGPVNEQSIAGFVKENKKVTDSIRTDKGPDSPELSRYKPMKVLESSSDLSQSGSDPKLVQPYGITTLKYPNAMRPTEHLYQSLHEVKTPLSQQNSIAPVLHPVSSSEMSDSPPPPPLSFKTHPTHSSSHSIEPFYHVLEQSRLVSQRSNSPQVTLEQNLSGSQGSNSPQVPLEQNPSGSQGSNRSQELPPPPPPPLYDEVTRERPQSSAQDSHTASEGGSVSSSSPPSASTTPTPRKERLYHVLEQSTSPVVSSSESESNEKNSFTISQSTCTSQNGMLSSQTTLSTVCSVRDNINDVFDETDGSMPFGGRRPPFDRQQTIDQAKLKSRSLPVGSRLGVRGRCNSEPNNQILGIMPYNTLERRMQGSWTLKRTLV